MRLQSSEQLRLPGRITGVGAHFLEVVTGAEAASCGRQDDGADLRILPQRIELGLQCRDHRQRQRVVALAAVQGDGRDATVARLGDERRFAGGRGYGTHANASGSSLAHECP
jgi:hypothetical protein